MADPDALGSPAEEHWREPIAIVGMHARFPGAENLEQYWENLAVRRDCIGPAPAGRPDREHLGDDIGAAGTAEGGFIEAIDAFDAPFFGIAEEEAHLMDPLQRLALESAWHCAENGGYRPSDLARMETGVFVACGKSDYEELLYRKGIAGEAKLATGVATSIIANRISFALGLTGPSMAIDTACSGSLTALHAAAQSIRSGDCTTAMVTAVSLVITPTLTRSLREDGVLSPDRRTRSFDARANGYVRGEGVASLLLKRRSQAVADGDRICGLLIGSAINHGGRANWLTAPNVMAQKQLIMRAWRRAGVDPATVTLLEAHGTATPLGDSIEFNAIRQAYADLAHSSAECGASNHCAIGSVKSNIGHLEAAAGLAGVIKVLLSMQHGRIPGNPLLREVNPACRTDGTPFRFVRETEDWKRLHDEDGAPVPHRAGVSSFGFGGACGHVMLEEFLPGAGHDSAGAEILNCLPISARDEDGLRRYAGRLKALAALKVAPARAATGEPLTTSSTPKDLADLQYTFQVGRALLPARVAILAGSWEALEASLADFLDGRPNPDVVVEGAETMPGRSDRGELGDLSAQFAVKWVAREKVDFADLYPRGARQRISAPTYPFARHRYWFDHAAANGPAQISDRATRTPAKLNAQAG